MPNPGTVSVALTVSDQAALHRVADRILQERGRPVVLTPRQVLAVTEAAGVDALVYDMESGDSSAVDVVSRVHAARPDWPIWLYYPPHPSVAKGVAEVASLRGVWATAQAAGPEHDAEIRMHLRRLVTSVPRLRVLHLLDSVLRQLPADVREFLKVGLDRLDGGGAQRFRVRNGTADDRGKLRRLERLCVKATGLGPKRLLDHLLLVFLAFKVLAFDVLLERAAEQAGLSPRDLDRLRRRVLGTDAHAAALDPRAQFEYALIALAKVCQAPSEAVGDIVHQVVREQLA